MLLHIMTSLIIYNKKELAISRTLYIKSLYVTITKYNNFTYLQQIIFIHVLNCSLINGMYVKK